MDLKAVGASSRAHIATGPADHDRGGDPEQWRRMRRRWDRLHAVRIVLDVAGFVLVALAAVGP